jgi:hypothetical protein
MARTKAMPAVPLFEIRFPVNEVPILSSRYAYKPRSEVERIGSLARARGHFGRDDLLAIIEWKAPRALPLARTNGDEYVAAISEASLAANDERFRIEVLTLLRGVSWPIASVLLHFCARIRYPILDYRALWSVGLDTLPPYSFELWEPYTHYCRELADKADVSMGDLDRALWQYSKEKQPQRPRPSLAMPR